MQMFIRKYTLIIQFLVCDKLYLYFQVNSNIYGPKSKLGSSEAERHYRKIKVVQEPLASNERVINRSVAAVDQDALLEYITQSQKHSF